MTRAASVLLAALLLTRPGAAEVYRRVDRQGVVHFTNRPPRRALPPVDASSTPLAQVDAYDPIIVAAADYYSLPTALLKAVIASESNFDPTATSVAGAEGLMQLMPVTAQLLAVPDSFVPLDNIFAGTRYLRVLVNRYGGDLRLALAAYNAGPAAVDNSVEALPNIAETRGYVKRVLALYEQYQAGTLQPF